MVRCLINLMPLGCFPGPQVGYYDLAAELDLSGNSAASGFQTMPTSGADAC